MDEIKELANKLADLCEQRKIPLLCAWGTDKISIVEFAPDSTPERLIKTRATLVNTTKQARRSLEIQA